MHENVKTTIVNEPNYRSKHSFFETWRIMFRNIWSSRFLIQQLFIRDFLAVYKKSFFGITWIMIAPLAGIVSWVFLQKTGMLNPGDMDVPYPVYVLVGTLCWSFFVGIFEAAGKTLQSGSSLVMQVNYPHEALLIKEIAQFLSKFLLKLTFVLVALLFFGVFPNWKIIFLPIVCLPTLFIASGLGLILSLFNVVTKDVQKIMSMGFKFLIWTVPIVYSSRPTNELIKTINDYNPLTYMICSMRDIVLYGNLYGTNEFFYCFVLSLVIFLVAWRLFYISELQLVERMV